MRPSHPGIVRRSFLTGAFALDRHQSLQTVSLSYNFLGHARFGAVEWRTDDATGR